ncbi:MAG: YggT family protein, partial [Ktedonobacterales bacterium]
DNPPPVWQNTLTQPASTPVEQPYVEQPYVQRERVYERQAGPVRPVPANAAASPWYAWRLSQIVYFIFGVIEALIFIRLVLRLLAANPDAAFTALMYQLSYLFVAPFEGVFPSPATNKGSVLELSAILAIIVYALLAYFIARLIELAQRRRTPVV